MKYLRAYISSFGGLSISIWYLALVTLINRAGTMVIPFLSIYMQEELTFSKNQISWILMVFGLGSLCGSWLGGKLTDRFGFYPVMLNSMFLTGLGFIAMQFLHSYFSVLVGVLGLMMIADTFRPASFAAIVSYSKPEDKTRSVTLIRLAINLGFMLGPALAGVIIVAKGYTLLFWIDGITCVLATVLITILLNPNKQLLVDNNNEVDNEEQLVKTSKIGVIKDVIYLRFLLIVFFMGFVFMQLFSTIPLYFKEGLGYNEALIGRLMLLNGAIIVLFEMPLISFFEKRKISKLIVIQVSVLLIGMSYLVLPIYESLLVVIISTLFITFGEMLAFPFSNALAMDKAPKKRVGEYLALYTMAFSFSHMVGPFLGMQIADKYGYNSVWYIMGVISVVAIIMLELLKRKINNRSYEVELA